MLARLSSFSTACLARRTTPSLQRLASQARFNSSDSETAAPPLVSDVDAAPKKRAIPIADSLGDITIASRTQQQEGQNRNGNGVRRQNGSGNGNGNWNRDPNRPQRPRQSSNNNFNRDGNGNGNPNRNRANAAGRGQNNPDGQRGGQRPPRQTDQAQGAQSRDPAQQQPQREQRRPRRPRDEDEEDHQPFNIPAPRKIEFGNLDELFGTSAARTRAPGGVKLADGAKQLSPSQDRVQTFLERTAGDYSRYVPKTLLCTDVRELTPLELGGFVLSKRRDVKLQAREKALAVVGKFPGTNAVVKGTEAPAPSS